MIETYSRYGITVTRKLHETFNVEIVDLENEDDICLNWLLDYMPVLDYNQSIRGMHEDIIDAFWDIENDCFNKRYNVISKYDMSPEDFSYFLELVDMILYHNEDNIKTLKNNVKILDLYDDELYDIYGFMNAINEYQNKVILEGEFSTWDDVCDGLEPGNTVPYLRIIKK